MSLRTNTVKKVWPDSEVPAVGIRIGGTTYVTPLVASTPQAVAQAAEWRFLVRALYVAADSPAVPGFTESQVDQVLWGESPADPEFLAALLRVLSASGRTSRRGKQASLLELDDREVGPAEPLPTFEEAQNRILGQFRRALEEREAANDVGPRRLPPRVPGSPRPELKDLGRLISDAPIPLRKFSPPDPEGFGTVAEFLQGLKDLRTWARMSLRDIEERTVELANEGEPVIWLPRATISDMLRREKLPKRDATRAYVMACGLTVPVQVRWLAMYDRLKHGGSAMLAVRAAGALPKAA